MQPAVTVGALRAFVGWCGAHEALRGVLEVGASLGADEEIGFFGGPDVTVRFGFRFRYVGLLLGGRVALSAPFERRIVHEDRYVKPIGWLAPAIALNFGKEHGWRFAIEGLYLGSFGGPGVSGGGVLFLLGVPIGGTEER